MDSYSRFELMMGKKTRRKRQVSPDSTKKDKVYFVNPSRITRKLVILCVDHVNGYQFRGQHLKERKINEKP